MLFTLLLSLSALPPARAYPIRPVPLHELVAKSDLIAVVRPGPSRPLVNGGRFSNGAGLPCDTRVELVVEDVLRGTDVPASVSTDYLPGMTCPGPPEYPEGERVLAFLARDEKSGWHAFALSYGTKLLDPAALDVYRARIREFVALIEVLPESWEDSPEFLEWLVRCAEEPATRWEGAYVFEPNADPRWDFGFEPPPTGLRHRLDRAQRSRLLTALLAARAFGEGELCLLQVLADEPSAALDDFALERLAALVPEEPRFAAPIMVLLAERSGDAEARRIAREFGEQWWRSRRGDDEFFATSVAALVQRVREPR